MPFLLPNQQHQSNKCIININKNVFLNFSRIVL